MGIFDSFNQRVTGLGLPGGLGLLQAGTDILGGQPIGQAVRGGLQTFQNVTQMDEERKRKELVQKLVSEGGFTPQEQALILASQNPASVAAQIRAQKAAAANRPKQATFSLLSTDEKTALGFKEDDIVLHTSCNHLFHKDCVYKWLKEYSIKCPICKIELVDGEPQL